MVYQPNKLVENDVKKQTQNNAGSTVVANTNVSPAAPQKNAGATTGQQYVPGSSIDTAKTGLVDTAQDLKIDNLADTAQKYNTPGTGVNSGGVNYAGEMQQLLTLPPTPENQQKMQALLTGRDLKIALNPDTYGQFANDAYTKAANNYLSYINPQSVDANKYLDSMRSNADNRYQAQMNLMQQQYGAQSKALAESYEKLRNQEFSNAARRAFGTEEVLAAQGLGRGKPNAPSSGFGETSRMMAQTSLNNNIANAYLAEQKALEELRDQHNQNQVQAFMDYADRASNIDLQALDQANSDRAHYFNVQNANIQNAANRDAFDWEKEAFYINRDEGVREFNTNALLELMRLNQDDRHHADSIALERELAKNKGNGGSYSGYTFGDGNEGVVADPSFTMTDAQASDYIRAALQEGGKTNAIYELAYLSNKGRISKMAEQVLIDELELDKNDGWLK